ncbi:MAG: hypothetical protein ABFE07_28580 [Armatimonadia bacterium]
MLEDRGLVVTDADVEAIELAVGMGAGAWDCVDPKEIIRAAWRVMDSKMAAQAVAKVLGIKPKCWACHGAGWCFGDELKQADEDTRADTMTKYKCDWCKGTGVAQEEE